MVNTDVWASMGHHPQRERPALLVAERLYAIDPERVQHRDEEAVGRCVRREIIKVSGRKLTARAAPNHDRQVQVIVAVTLAAVVVVHRQAVVQDR